MEPTGGGSKAARIASIVGQILGLIAFMGMVLRLVNDVRVGHGLDYYVNGLGVQMNAIGALVMLAIAIPLAIVVVIVASWKARNRD